MDTDLYLDNSEHRRSSHQEADFLEEKERLKTPLRMKYEAECEVIRKKLGDLDDIRRKLGLTQRKICQLLMVDPSAWSRWQKKETQVPPHIYRSLQWYMALIEKSPEWHPANTYLGAFRPPANGNNNLSDKIHEEIDDIQRQLKTSLHHNHLFMEEMRKQTQIHWGWKLIMMLNLIALLFNVIF